MQQRAKTEPPAAKIHVRSKLFSLGDASISGFANNVPFRRFVAAPALVHIALTSDDVILSARVEVSPSVPELDNVLVNDVVLVKAVLVKAVLVKDLVLVKAVAVNVDIIVELVELAVVDDSNDLKPAKASAFSSLVDHSRREKSHTASGALVMYVPK